MNTFAFARWSVSRLLGLLLCFGVAPAAMAASLTVTPAMGVGGGSRATEVTVHITGLTWPNQYQLDFLGSPATDVALLQPNESGDLTTVIRLPALPTGAGRMRLKTTTTASVVIASTAFTSLGTLAFTTPATNISAGQSIPFEVTGLTTGSMTLEYEGTPVVGPVAVGEGAYANKFLVPVDRPATLPANAKLAVINKVGTAVVNRLFTSLPVQEKLAAPFVIRNGEAPPNEPYRGQNFRVSGNLTTYANESVPDLVSLWYFGSDGDVFPLASGPVSTNGTQSQYLMHGAAPGGFSMTAGTNTQGSVRLMANGSNAMGVPLSVATTPVNASMRLLADGRWRIRVRVTKPDGQPIAGALVQFDGAPVVEHDDGSNDDYTLLGHIMGSAAPMQYAFMRATDSRGCPLTLGRQLSDANGVVDFEFLDEDLAFAQAPQIYAEAGGTIQTFGQMKTLRLAIDASAQGYGFQYTSGPLQGDFLPHIFRVNFVGAGDEFTDDDYIEIIDDYQDVLMYSGPRDATYTQGLPPIQSMVGLYDTSILPWTAVYEAMAPSSGGETASDRKLVYGPIFSKRGINASWITELPSQGFPTSIAVRTDPAVSGVVTQAQLFLDANRNGSPEFIANFTSSPSQVDCSISGLNASMTWRANLAAVNLPQQASGRIEGYLYFKGSPSAGERKQYIAIRMKEEDLDWLAAARYSDREVAFSDGGQRIGIFATEDTADAEVQLDENPGYEIGRLKNSTDNTRIVAMYRNKDGTDSNMAPLDGEHREAGRAGTPTSVNPAFGTQYGPNILTLIDQSFPLFYYVWGVPVLAGVEVGADFSLLAKISTMSKFELKANKEPKFTMKTTPSLDLGLNFYLDLDVLFDLVDGGVDLDAIFGLQMPITVNAANPNGIVDECFTASLIFSWHFEVFCLPLDFICDALNDISGSELLVNEQTGSGCNNQPLMSPLAGTGSTRPSARIVPAHSAVAYAENGRGFIAFTRDDSNGGAPPVLVVRPADGGNFGRNSDDVILSSAPGIRSVDITFYDSNKAMMVWAESDRDYPTLSRMSVPARIARQRLMYATFNGETWSAKTALTSARFGEGGVDLAACVRNADQCPVNGEVFATWTRDSVGDITQHRSRVYTARYVPGTGWTTPAAVDATAVLDSAPSAGYVDGKPVVAFVRSTSGVFGDTDARRIAYRFVTVPSSQVVVPANLPGGVAWPSIVGLPGGKFALVHTHANDARAFVGNTQRAALVNGSNCANGSCTVAAQPLTDSHGRAIYGERPTPVIDNSGHVSVVMRGMGYGVGSNGSNVNPSDSIGMALHTGDVISFAVNPQQPSVIPRPLSSDGAGHFATTATFDPALGQIVATSSRGLEIPFELRAKFQDAGAEPAPARARAVTADPGLLVFSASQGVDLAVEEVTPNSPNLVAGRTIRIDTLIRNLGTDFASSLPQYQMKLSWDAPHDAGGLAAGSRVIASLASGEARVTSIIVTVPAGFSPDQSHRLYASLVRGANPVEDIDGSNDSRYTSFGGMPVPQQLTASSVPGTTLVQLTWAAPADPLDLIAGYRVWCHDGNSQWRHLGSSFELGFLDLAAPVGVERHYRVTSYSSNAIESEPSDEAVSSGVPFDRIFANSFDP